MFPLKQLVPVRGQAINRSQPLFLAGHRGLLGSALLNALRRKGYGNILTASSDVLDLTDASAVEHFFANNKPAYVILAAALVGGINANINRSADFIHINLAIQNNVISCAQKHNVEKLVFFGSSCMYPTKAAMPIAEESLLAGLPEITSLPYAIAKIAGIVQCQAYRAQYGLNAITIIPASLYGPGDHFDNEGSHVLSALLQRFMQAVKNGESQVEVWGDGTPKREFLFVEDAAEAIVFLFENFNNAGPINLGSNQEVSIAELAALIANTVGYSGKIVFDSTKPNGASRKVLESSRIRGLGWSPTTSLSIGLEKTYRWLLDCQKNYQE